MSSCNKAIFLLLPIAMVALILAQPGLAHRPPPPPPPPSSVFPINPRPFPLDPEELMKCWSSLLRIEGCKMEILRTFFTGNFNVVRPVCCKASMAIDNNCWPKMFPFNPFFPPLLKDACSRSVGKPAAPLKK